MTRVANLLGSPELYALHPLAPWAAYAIQVVASTDADPDGWIGGFRATPTAWAAILGPAGQHAGATVETLADARDAMVNGGLLQAVDDRVRLEDADERRRRGNRERQRARRERACDSHATVTRDSHATVTATVTQPVTPHVTPPVTQPTVTPGHDAPAGSTCDQDRHYLGIPSGCSKKEGEGEGEGGVGEGEPVRPHPPRLALVPPEPAPPPVPKGHRRPKAPLRSREDTIDAAQRTLPDDPCHPMWQAFSHIMDSRWTISGLEPRPCWEIPGFDTVRIAQKLGAPQYDSVPKEEILRACDRLEVDTKDTKSDLGLYLLGWFNREIKFQSERSARYGGAR